MDFEVRLLDGDETSETFGDAVEDDEGLVGPDSSTSAGMAAALGAALRFMSRIWASTTSVIEAMNTKVPMTLMRGLTCPWRKPSTLTGSVSLRPETNQATANSSKETAMVMNSAAKIAGLQKGTMTWRIAFHSDAPRFHAAASSVGSIWDSLRRMIAMAKGAHITTWAMMTEWMAPDRLMLDRNASMARPRMTTGIVGGSSASAR